MSEYLSNIEGLINKLISAQSSEDDELTDEAKEDLRNFNARLRGYTNQQTSLNNDGLEYREQVKKAGMSKIIGTFVDKFSSIPKQVLNLRSNFIPIESMNSNSASQAFGAFDVGGESTSVPDNFSIKESFENTFMRILGMPESSDIGPEEEIYVIDSDFNLKKIKFEKLYSEFPGTRSVDGLDILDERQRNFSDRIYQFTGYSIDKMVELLKATPKAPESISTGQNVQAVLTEFVDAIYINDNNSYLQNITYLKCVPIQDSRFLRCINEPGKIISKPFDDKMIKVVNNEKIKTSFLENLIRLRLDKISGRTYGDDSNSSINSTSLYTENEIDSFSVIEQLLLERLLEMLSSLSHEYYISLKQSVEQATAIVQQELELSQQRAALEAAAAAKADAAANNTDAPPPKVDDSADIISLKNALDIQDAILGILKDTSVSSYIYELTSGSTSSKAFEGYIRNSSGFDDEISNSIISIIEAESSIYRDLLKQKSKPDPKSGTGSGGGGDASTAALDTIAGSDSMPIGIFDILVYALALFSMDETSLLNLLNQSQKQNLAKILSKDATADSLFSSKELNLTSPVDSINKLTIAIYFYYKFFFNELSFGREEERKNKAVQATINEVGGITIDSDGSANIA
jgi:hypothetical protein